MATINGHTTRAVGTVLTAEIYNADHLNHVSNASILNTDKMEGTPPPVVDGHAVVWNGVGGNVLRTAGFVPANKAGETYTGTHTFTGTVVLPNGALFAKGAGSEGGQLNLEKPTDSSLSQNVIVDINGTSIRIFENAPTFRGAYLDIAACTAAVATALWHDNNYAARVAAMSGGGTANFLRADGTWATPPLPPVGSITLGTEQATTSGTSKDFTGIPAGVKRITVMLDGISYTTNGKSVAIQLGDSGGIEATGYAPYGPTTSFTVSFNVNAADTYYGAVSLDLMNSSSNKWMCTVPSIGGQTKSLSGTLDRVRILSDGTFDAGTVNISYES